MKSLPSQSSCVFLLVCGANNGADEASRRRRGPLSWSQRSGSVQWENSGSTEAFWRKAEWMKEWKHVGHPEFSPSGPCCEPRPLPGLRRAPLQISVQITSSASQKKASGVRRSHSPTPHPPRLNPSLAWREADGASRMALDCTCTGGFPVTPPTPFSSDTLSSQTNTLLPRLQASIRSPTNTADTQPSARQQWKEEVLFANTRVLLLHDVGCGWSIRS